jgi:hypothetical protein
MWVKKDGDQQIMLCTHVDDSFVTASSGATLINFLNRMLSAYGGRFDGTADMDAKRILLRWVDRDMGKPKRRFRRRFVKKKRTFFLFPFEL